MSTDMKILEIEIIHTQKVKRINLKIYLFHNTHFYTSLISPGQKLMREGENDLPEMKEVS